MPVKSSSPERSWRLKTDVGTVRTRTSGGTRRRLARLGRGREKQAPW